ncbi:MAG: 2'-deoxycytidine 5'-triphosphate deaminase [Mycobacteriales bacterium]
MQAVRGVLSDRMLAEAIGAGYLRADPYRIRPDQIQPASVDLTLGETAHRLRASFLPDREPVAAKLAGLSQGQIDLHRGGFLEHRVPYLIELREELELPQWLRGKANPKSSTGRIDVFTRLITDRNFLFDEVPAGYRGKLYLEVVPISFPIKVAEGLSLNQLRLIGGAANRLSDADIADTHRQAPLLYRGVDPVAELSLAAGLLLSVDLTGAGSGLAGYKARSHTRLLDLTTGAPLPPEDFWEPVYAEPGQRIVLDPEAFYLLLSREGVRVPPQLASEMVAYDPTSGELRTHYAGFFDPGFGFGPDCPVGTRAALEVRAHDVPFMVEHGQAVCKLGFEPMAGPPERLYGSASASHYGNQVSTLSRYFAPPGQP